MIRVFLLVIQPDELNYYQLLSSLSTSILMISKTLEVIYLGQPSSNDLDLLLKMPRYCCCLKLLISFLFYLEI